MATQSVSATPSFRVGRRGDPVACDCCGKPLASGYHARPDGGWEYVWSEVECGPASFAWVTCHACLQAGHDHEMHWSEKALIRAKRHGKAWEKSVERMIMVALQ